jgi:hypothetical protein
MRLDHVLRVFVVELVAFERRKLLEFRDVLVRGVHSAA